MDIQELLQNIFPYLYPDCGRRPVAPETPVEVTAPQQAYRSSDQFINRLSAYLGSDSVQMLDGLRQRQDPRWPALQRTLNTYLERQQHLDGYHWNTQQIPFQNLGFYLNEFSFNVYVRLNDWIGEAPYELRPDLSFYLRGSENEFNPDNAQHSLRGSASLTNTFWGDNIYALDWRLQQRQLRTPLPLPGDWGENSFNTWFRQWLVSQTPAGYRLRDGFALPLGALRFHSSSEARVLQPLQNIAASLENNNFGPIPLDLLAASLMEFLTRRQNPPLPFANLLAPAFNPWMNYIQSEHPEDIQYYSLPSVSQTPIATLFSNVQPNSEMPWLIIPRQEMVANEEESFLKHLRVVSEFSLAYLVLGPDFFVLSPSQNQSQLQVDFDPNHLLSTLELRGEGSYLWQAMHLPGNLRLGAGRLGYEVRDDTGPLNINVHSLDLNFEASQINSNFRIESLRIQNAPQQELEDLTFLPGVQIRRLSVTPLVFGLHLNLRFQLSLQSPQGLIQAEGTLLFSSSLSQSQSTLEWHAEAGQTVLSLRDLNIRVPGRQIVREGRLTISDHAPFIPDSYRVSEGFYVSTQSDTENGEGFISVRRNADSFSYNLSSTLEKFHLFFRSFPLGSSRESFGFSLTSALANTCSRNSHLKWNFSSLPFSSFLQSSRGHLNLEHGFDSHRENRIEAELSTNTRLTPQAYQTLRRYIPGIEVLQHPRRTPNINLRGHLHYENRNLRLDVTHASASLLGANVALPLIHSLDLSLRAFRGQCILNSWLTTDLRGASEFFTLPAETQPFFQAHYTRRFATSRAQVPFACRWLGGAR